MKYRGGFVSNSSSSSFIIALKDENLTVELLTDYFGVPETSPLANLSRELAEEMYDLSNKMDLEELQKNFGYDSLEEAIDDNNLCAKYIKDGYVVYEGWASNESSSIEMALYNMHFDFESDKLIIKSGE